MKRVSVLAFVLSGLVVAGQPKVVVDNDYYDFGEALLGSKVTHSFKLQNKGDGLLKIIGVRTSCGCTVAELPKKELKPGESVDVTVTFDTKGRKGRQLQMVSITTNDPSKPTLRLKIGGVVATLITFSPMEKVYFWNVRRKQGDTKELKIFSTKNIPLKVLEAKPSKDWIAVGVKEIQEGGKTGALLKVEVKPNAPKGMFLEFIKLKLVADKEIEQELPVRGTILGDVSVMPRTLYFGAIRRGEETVRKVRITIHKDSDARLVKYASNKFVSLSVSGQKPIGRKGVILDCVVRKDAPPGAMSEPIYLFFSDPEEPLVEIPILGYIKSEYKVSPRAIVKKLPVKAGDELCRVKVSLETAPGETTRTVIKGGRTSSKAIALTVEGNEIAVKAVDELVEPLEATVTIELNDKIEQLINVPVLLYK